MIGNQSGFINEFFSIRSKELATGIVQPTEGTLFL
jgi:hypothetical protein